MHRLPSSVSPSSTSAARDLAPGVAASAGARCGPYQLEALIGRGGQGSVWRARRVDGRYDSTVAIKLLGGVLRDARSARRFRREGELLARLQHPGIAALLDAGTTDDGAPYLVLECVEGEPIDAWVRARALDPRAVVRLMLQACAAVAHAHTRLVVHRDLKPANLLVESTGRVRLLDFGIAQLLDDNTLATPDDATVATSSSRRPAERTLDGGGAMTPHYAAPEQLRREPATMATDVYALGVLLTQLLSGALPYRITGASPGLLEAAILYDEPLLPSALVTNAAHRRVLRGDLDTIVRTALQKEPASRYTTVEAFARDLERWLDGQPIAARAPSVGYRLRRFVRRHALALGAIVLATTALLAGAGVAVRQARAARVAQARADAVSQFVQGIFTEADMARDSTRVVTGRDVLLQAYARLDDAFGTRSDERLDLQLLLAQALVRLQAYDVVDEILGEARRDALARYGPADARVLQADLLAASMYRYRGELDSMRAATTRVLTTMRAAPRLDTALLIAALNDSVTLAIASGTGPKAVPLAADVLALARRVLPFDDERVAAAAQNVVVTLQRANASPDSLRAAAAFALAATRARHAASSAHPSVITSMMVYAVSLDADGRTPEAIAVLDSAVALEQAARPDTPLGRAFALGNAATYRRAIGALDVALAHFDSSVVAFRRLGDTVGANYAITLANRGETQRLRGALTSANDDLRRAHALIAAQWGERHQLAVLIRLRQVMIYAERGDLRAAERLLAPIEAGGLSAGRPLDYAVARAWLARRRGESARALAAIEEGMRALPRWRNATTERDRAPLLAHRGLALADAGRSVEARVALDEALRAYAIAGVVQSRLADEVRVVSRRLAAATDASAPVSSTPDV